MKKLVCAAVVAASMFAMADEAAKPAPAAPAAAETVKAARQRPQFTPEQRQQMIEQHQQKIAARKAQMEAKLLEVIKKYIPEEEKAQALLKDLQEAMLPVRRGPKIRPAKAEKPAEAK